MEVLKFDNVNKIFYTKQHATVAVSNLSFVVNEGEFVALIGPSGCGKTTILSLVCGLIEPTSGSIIRGTTQPKLQTTQQDQVQISDNGKTTVSADACKRKTPLKDSVKRLKKGFTQFTNKLSKKGLNDGENGAAHASVGYMLQRDQLFEWRTIEKNITLGLEVQHKMTEENVERARELLKKYGLWEFRNHYPQQLSGGMRQRAALIRTIAANPDLLLLDEPFSALDFQTRLDVCDDVYDIIKKEHKTALLVTHDISEAIALADKVIVLTARPATVKEVHYTNLADIETPLKRRQSPDFSAQFEKLHNLLHG